MTFAPTALDLVLLALVANGGVALDTPDGDRLTAYPRPAQGGHFAPVLRERMTLLVSEGLVVAGGYGQAQLSLYGTEVLRGR
ncbi:hypothetical protein [Flindersiella endophytica]